MTETSPGPDATAGPHPTSFVAGLSLLATSYDVVFCDVWGVLHDGIVGFRGAHDALAAFRDGGGCVVLVSNAPRPGHVVADQLARFGVSAKAFDAVVTSGDLTREIVRSRGRERVFHLGPDRDRRIYDGLGTAFVDSRTCDYVVCTGLVDDDVDTIEDYGPLLREMRVRDLWMLCANPDLIVERGDRLLCCAGALGAAYEDLGGATFYPGKPHAPIYDEALARAASIRGAAIDRRRVLAIGDALRTDVAGANAFGIDSLLIARGIHAAELGFVDGTLNVARALAWVASQSVKPTALAGELVWG